MKTETCARSKFVTNYIINLVIYIKIPIWNIYNYSYINHSVLRKQILNLWILQKLHLLGKFYFVRIF